MCFGGGSKPKVDTSGQRESLRLQRRQMAMADYQGRVQGNQAARNQRISMAAPPPNPVESAQAATLALDSNERLVERGTGRMSLRSDRPTDVGGGAPTLASAAGRMNVTGPDTREFKPWAFEYEDEAMYGDVLDEARGGVQDAKGAVKEAKRLGKGAKKQAKADYKAARIAAKGLEKPARKLAIRDAKGVMRSTIATAKTTAATARTTARDNLAIAKENKATAKANAKSYGPYAVVKA